jgi:serine/threonine protein phosphatase PrpC
MKNEENKNVFTELMNKTQKNGKKNHKSQIKFVREQIEKKRKYPPHVVISTPDIHYHLPHSNLHFVLLASDGVYDFLKNQKIVEFLEKKLFSCKSTVLDEKFLNSVCHDLCNEALRSGSKDDLTALLIVFV